MTKAELDIININADIRKKNSESIKFIEESEVIKVAELRRILETHYIDDDRSIIGSEPFFVLVVTGKNRDIVLGKLIEIINNF